MTQTSPGGSDVAQTFPGGSDMAQAFPGGTDMAQAFPGGLRYGPNFPTGLRYGPNFPRGLRYGPNFPRGLRCGPTLPTVPVYIFAVIIVNDRIRLCMFASSVQGTCQHFPFVISCGVICFCQFVCMHVVSHPSCFICHVYELHFHL